MWHKSFITLLTTQYLWISTTKGVAAQNVMYVWYGDRQVMWHEAFSTCRSLGGNLASPVNPTMDDDLRQYMLLTMTSANVWIGGQVQIHTTPTWWWVGPNLAILYNSFFNDGCNRPEINYCLGVGNSIAGEWGWCGYDCNQNKSFVCEFTANPSTTESVQSTTIEGPTPTRIINTTETPFTTSVATTLMPSTSSGPVTGGSTSFEPTSTGPISSAPTSFPTSVPTNVPTSSPTSEQTSSTISSLGLQTVPFVFPVILSVVVILLNVSGIIEPLKTFV